MNLGRSIQVSRKNIGLKQNKLAELCNITPSYLSQIENNLKDPNISTLKVISDKLGVPLPILFFSSLDEADISPKKRDAFKLIFPSINSLISEFFGKES